MDEVAEISSDESEDEYGPDLYKDEDDRYRLAQMTDMDRQAILYERGEKRNAIRERNQLKAQLRRARGLPASSKGASGAIAKKTRSRAATTASADAPKRNVSSKKAALDALKERRKADGARSRKMDQDEDSDYDNEPRAKSAAATKPKEVKETARSAKQRMAAEAKAQRMRDRHRLDSEDEEDPSYNEIVYDDKGKRIILTAEVDQEYLSKMIVKRDELVKWMNDSHFGNTIKGSFVRLSLGMNDSGEPIYRLAEIIDHNPNGRSYELPPDATSGGRPRPATTTISVAIGAMIKEQTLERVSNRPFTPEEYESWVTSVKTNQKLALPTRRTALNVAKNLKDARTYVRTEADMERDLVKNMEKERLKREQRANDFSSHNSNSADSKRTDIVSQINKRNRSTNSAVEAAYTPESAAESAMNPFARLPTLTTQVGTRTTSSSNLDTTNGGASTQASTNGSSSSSTTVADARNNHSSSSQASYGSSAPGRSAPIAQRTVAAPVTGSQPQGRTISLNQYFNRR